MKKRDRKSRDTLPLMFSLLFLLPECFFLLLHSYLSFNSYHHIYPLEFLGYL